MRDFDDAYVIDVKGAGASLGILQALVKEVLAGLSDDSSAAPSVQHRRHNNKINPDFEAQVMIGYATPIAWEQKHGFDSGVEEIDPAAKLEELRAIFKASDEIALQLAEVDYSAEHEGCFEINVPYAA